MKILMYRWKAYNQQDIVDQLELRGHIVHEIKGEMDNYEHDPIFEECFTKALEEEQYDLVFTVNFFPNISNICQAKNISYVSWCCDCPIATMYNSAVFNEVNIIFNFDKLNQLEFEAMGAPVYYLPLCGAVERARKAIGEADEAAKLAKASAISFIGSMYNKNSYDELYEHFPEYLKGYFDAALKMQKNAYGIYLLDDVLDGDILIELEKYFKLDKTEESFSDLQLVFSTTVLAFKIAQLERKEMIAELSKHFDVNVYTDDDKVDFIKARNCGYCDYWNDSPVVFNQSKINLNLTLKSIRSGIPLRVWDILAAGGFCITNYQPELELYFKNGEDLVFFEDKYDLVKKVRYYLEHEEERKAIALNGQKKVEKYHTYQHRFDEMAGLIEGL